MTPASFDDRLRPDAVPPRVLLAVHGHEAPTWPPEACRALSLWRNPVVRVLAVLDVPSPPLTALGRHAGRAYRAARTEWARLEAARLQPALDRLLPLLPAGVEVVHAPSVQGDPGRAIAQGAREWPADVVLVGAPAPGVRRRLWPGAVHERVLRHAACPVLLTPPLSAPGPLRPRLLGVPRALGAGRRAVPTGQGA
jgi:nucleotide-binding universal stress UspA family protein